MQELKIRKRNGRKEYLLQVRHNGGGFTYNDWYTGRQLTDLPECDISLPTLWARINTCKKHGVSRFSTLWEIVTMSNTKPSTSIKREHVESDEFEKLMKLWPAGSMCAKARIMGSIEL